ncbi:MAG: (2Fe-2S)-binding protein [Deltaproteobacteria bacterium]|nr:(2Fe-2S)-binding protein [Deltaproteobacteria bacterium]
MKKMRVACEVNGVAVVREVAPGATLLDFLRYDVGLTGSKEGCGKGECGACTVEVDGRLVTSCLMLAAQVEGRRVRTIEGLGEGHANLLHPVQAAFLECGAVQCGFCTPGFVMAAAAVVDACARHGGRAPTAREVEEGLEGNLCRCTGYQKIRVAVARGVEIAAAECSRKGRDGAARAGTPRTIRKGDAR